MGTSNQDGSIGRHGSLAHNHIKITTEIENNCHSQPSEIKSNGSLTAMELKKPHPSGLVGEAQMLNGLVTHPCVIDKNLGGISWEQGVPAHTRLPSPGFQCQEDKSPTISSCKNQQGLSWWKKLLELQAVLLEERTNRLTYSDSLPLSSSTGVAA